MVSLPLSPLAQRTMFGAIAQPSGQRGTRSSPIGRLSLAADQRHKNSPDPVSRTSISAMLISCARAGAASSMSAATRRSSDFWKTPRTERWLLAHMAVDVLLEFDFVFLRELANLGRALLRCF